MKYENELKMSTHNILFNRIHDNCCGVNSKHRLILAVLINKQDLKITVLV